MLDADGQADGAVEYADAQAHVRRHAGVRGGGWMARQRLGAAEADRELEELQRVEKAECRGLPAGDVEGEGRAGAGALRGIDAALWRIRCVEGQVVQALDAGVIAQE